MKEVYQQTKQELFETYGKRSKTRRSDTVPILRYDIRSLFI